MKWVLLTLARELTNLSVTASTIDSVQGEEGDVVILMAVRSTNKQDTNLSFVEDPRRLDVTLTRARHCFWVVGNVDTLKQTASWEHYIADTDRRGVCVVQNCLPPQRDMTGFRVSIRVS